MTTHYGKAALQVLTDNCEDYGSMVDDEQVKVNHVTCDMGEDTKERLYVKRSNGSYLWHCHNCGDSGFYRDNSLEHIASRDSKLVAMPKSHVDFTMYYQSETTIERFPLEQQLWLLQYEFDEEAIAKNSIRGGSAGIFLPIWHYGLVTGFQIRQFNKQPKYLTYAQTKFSHIHANADMLIITEDLMSSYKLRLVGHSTLALLGTTLHDEVVDLILKLKYKKVVVWLDDDVAGHRGMKDIINYLRPVVKNVSAVDLAQPKELSFSFLSSLNFEGT